MIELFRTFRFFWVELNRPGKQTDEILKRINRAMNSYGFGLM